MADLASWLTLGERWLQRRCWNLRGKGYRSRAFVRSLAALRCCEHPLARDLAEAIEKTADGRFSDADRALLGRIEALREDLSHSAETIEQHDFGAGDPWSPKSWEQARRGVVKTLPLRKLASYTSIGQPWCGLLFNLIRILRPARALELGTCIGFSAAYQCAAMASNGHGELVSLEGCENFAAAARANLASLALSNAEILVGPFEDTLDRTLRAKQPFDFMFNDGHHDGDAVLRYFERSIPYFAGRSVILFDDIDHYASMWRGWTALTRHAAVAVSIDFGRIGLVVLGKDPGPRRRFHVRFP